MVTKKEGLTNRQEQPTNGSSSYSTSCQRSNDRTTPQKDTKEADLSCRPLGVQGAIAVTDGRRGMDEPAARAAIVDASRAAAAAGAATGTAGNKTSAPQNVNNTRIRKCITPKRTAVKKRKGNADHDAFQNLIEKQSGKSSLYPAYKDYLQRTMK
uniref:YABBY protein n=1 Tax=Steinernema glaseri TaxID=37863 RepID=A0A1I7ZKJ5_9BILA